MACHPRRRECSNCKPALTPRSNASRDRSLRIKPPTASLDRVKILPACAPPARTAVDEETLEALVTPSTSRCAAQSRRHSEEVGMASLEPARRRRVAYVDSLGLQGFEGRGFAREIGMLVRRPHPNFALMRALNISPVPWRFTRIRRRTWAPGTPRPVAKTARGSPRVVCDGDKGSHVLSADAGACAKCGAEVEFAPDSSVPRPSRSSSADARSRTTWNCARSVASSVVSPDSRRTGPTRRSSRST